MDTDSDFDFTDIFLDEKLYREKYENILVYGISYKTSRGEKPLRIRFNKIDGFIKTNNGNRCLVLFEIWVV